MCLVLVGVDNCEWNRNSCYWCPRAPKQLQPKTKKLDKKNTGELDFRKWYLVTYSITIIVDIIIYRNLRTQNKLVSEVVCICDTREAGTNRLRRAAQDTRIRSVSAFDYDSESVTAESINGYCSFIIPRFAGGKKRCKVVLVGITTVRIFSSSTPTVCNRSGGESLDGWTV